MGAASEHGFDPDRLARIGAFLDAKYVAPGRMPGAVLLVSRRGRLAYRAVLGKRDLERGLPCKEDTLFRLYSMTKPLTSVAAMMLVEEGRLLLDDPVDRYIPAFGKVGVHAGGEEGSWRTTPPARPMQVVDLLRHTSGLTYGFQQRTAIDAAYRRMETREPPAQGALAAFAEALAEFPLEFSPGEAWNYSMSTDLLGYLVEVVAGQPFEDFLADRVLEPLGMADTAFQVPPGAEERFAACYEQGPGGRLELQDDPRASRFLQPPRFVSGGGGLVGTAGDYLRFCQMMLNGGALDGRRLLAPHTVSLMTANHLPGGQDLTRLSRSLFSESTYAGVGFGLGFAVVVDPPKTLLPSSPGEYFWGGMASTTFWIDPVEDIAVVFMTQLMPSSAWPVRRELRNLVYAALVDPNAR